MPLTKLEDFVENDIESRIAHHQEIAKTLPREARADYWRLKVWKDNPDICKFQTGYELAEIEKRRKKFARGQKKRGNLNVV